MKNRKVQFLQLFLFLILFLFSFYFFTEVKPITFFDTDDWDNVALFRLPIPVWGKWNPSKIFPEFLMPYASKMFLALFYPNSLDYFQSQNYGTAILVSGTIGLFYVLLFGYLTKKAEAGTYLSLTAVLLLYVQNFTFLKHSEYMLWALDYTCYYHYILSSYLNLIALLILMSNAGKNHRGKAESVLRGILLYFCMFSNLYSSIVLAAYAGSILLRDWFRQKSVRKSIAAHKESALILFLWFCAMIFEKSGGRADARSGMFETIAALKTMAEIPGKISSLWLAVSALILVFGIVLIFRKQGHPIIREDLSILIISFILTSAYLVLLSAKVDPSYLLRPDAMYSLFGLFQMISALCFSGLTSRTGELPLCCAGLFVVVLSLCLHAPMYQLKESNAISLEPERCARINAHIFDTVMDADRNSDTDVTITIPDFHQGDNFPLSAYAGKRIARTLYKQGIISHEIQSVFEIEEEYEY